MAELADAQRSGRCMGDHVQVRILSGALAFGLNLTFQMPQWRNWQTRNVQVVVWVTMYRFESCLGHYSNSRCDTAVFYLLDYYDIPTHHQFSSINQFFPILTLGLRLSSNQIISHQYAYHNLPFVSYYKMH